MRILWGVTVAVLGLLLVAPWAGAAVRLVPQQYATIQAAVNASQAGDEVVVAAGTYSDPTHPAGGGDATLCCVVMKSDITLRGAGKGLTIIDPDSSGRGIHLGNVAGCKVYDLTVRNAYSDVYGTGIFARKAGALIRRVEMIENHFGAIAIVDTSNVQLIDSDMLYNEGKAGAGLEVESSCTTYVYNCDIIGNSGPASGGVQLRGDVTMEHCLVEANEAQGASGIYGGGIGLLKGTPVLRDCIIRNNIAGYGGGGLFIVGDSTFAVVEDCLIEGNRCDGDEGSGGGILVSSFATPTVRRCVIVNNTSTGEWAGGGGLSVEFANLNMENCTLHGNAVTGDSGNGGNVYMWPLTGYNQINIAKTIITGATQGAGMACMASPELVTVACCDVWGNAGGDQICGVATNCFSQNPLFCDAPDGNLYLQASSPCAPGHHPGGPTVCGGALIGARQTGCDSGIDEGPLTSGTRFLGNRPNPFDRGTLIAFALASDAHVSIEVFDPSGRCVAVLHDGPLSAGEHSVAWDGSRADGSRAGSGAYFCRLRAGGETQGLRMLHLE